MFRTRLGTAARRRTNDGKRIQGHSAYHRRIAFEPLEYRRVLSIAGPSMEPLGTVQPELLGPSAMHFDLRAEGSAGLGNSVSATDNLVPFSKDAVQASSSIDDATAIDFIREVWHITQLTDTMLSDTLDLGYNGIPYRESGGRGVRRGVRPCFQAFGLLLHSDARRDLYESNLRVRSIT